MKLFYKISSTSSIGCTAPQVIYIVIYSDIVYINATPITIIGAKTKRDRYLTLYDMDSRVIVIYEMEIHILLKTSPSIYRRRYAVIDGSSNILLKDGIYKDGIL